MNFSLNKVLVKSSWFDENGKIKKIGCNGFYLYLNLFRFYLGNQDCEYTFVTSLGMLRKETGMRTKDIYEQLRLLVSEKIIKINITRWDRMFDSDGKLCDDKLIIIYASDAPNVKKEKNKKDKIVDQPVTEDDKYIAVNMEMIQHYINTDLKEKYCAMYCLIRKWSNGLEGKSWISINKIADILGIKDQYVNHMVYELNRKELMASYYREKGKNKNNVMEYRFEHYILGNLEHRKNWLRTHKEQIERNKRKWDKKKK